LDFILSLGSSHLTKKNYKVDYKWFFSCDSNIYFKVRQGYPWALLLFLVTIEPLAYNMRNSQIGIWLTQVKTTYKGYVDDMCCYVFDLSHIKRMLEIFAFCKEVFGLKLI